MQSVGQKLCDARLRNKLTLEQVSEKTRISVKNLRAIESNDLTKLSTFFYKSFVRQFADQVGVDYDKDLAPLVLEATRTLPEPLIPGQGDAPLPKISNLRAVRPKRFRWVYSVASLVIMVAACSSLYAMWEDSKSNLGAAMNHWVQSLEKLGKKPANTPVARAATQMAAARPKSETPKENPPAAESPAIEASTANTPVVSAPVANPPVANPPVTNASDSAAAEQNVVPLVDGYRIVLSAIERTWLSVTTDGKPAFSGILQVDESKVLEGHDRARLRTGNAGGISIVFNGKSIGSLGARGQVRTIIFTKNSYEIVDPGPHMAMTDFNRIAERMLPVSR